MCRSFSPPAPLRRIGPHAVPKQAPPGAECPGVKATPHPGKKGPAVGGPRPRASPAAPPPPVRAPVTAAIPPRRGDANADSFGVARIRQTRMQTEPAESWHPEWTLGMIEQRLDRMERLAAIIGTKQRGRIGSREYHF